MLGAGLLMLGMLICMGAWMLREFTLELGKRLGGVQAGRVLITWWTKEEGRGYVVW